MEITGEAVGGLHVNENLRVGFVWLASSRAMSPSSLRDQPSLTTPSAVPEVSNLWTTKTNPIYLSMYRSHSEVGLWPENVSISQNLTRCWGRHGDSEAGDPGYG